jgi:hypothetical protein
MQKVTMVKRIIGSIMFVLVTIMLTPYLAMSITAMRLISLNEYAIYTNAILRAALGHTQEAGGLLALDYAPGRLDAHRSDGRESFLYQRHAAGHHITTVCSEQWDT